MREILFRGKSIQGNDWEYGGILPQNSEREVVIISGAAFLLNTRWQITDFSFVDPTTVGQYTGLSDKNGHKIFEGDIVRQQYPGGDTCLFRIMWSAIFLKFEGIPIDKFLEGRFHFNGGLAGYREVVGNIYDNPELMGNDE